MCFSWHNYVYSFPKTKVCELTLSVYCGSLCLFRRNNYTFIVVSLRRLLNILYPPAYTKKNHYNFASLSCEKRPSYFYVKTWSWDVSWIFWRKFMAIRFYSDPVRVLSIGRNPIQVLLIRFDAVRVLSIRSDPIRSRFCKRPMLYIKQLTPSLNVQTDSIRAKVFV